MKNKIIQGDAIEELKKLDENSVDSVVTDPPYGLEFMGKDWDKFGVSKARAKRLLGSDNKGTNDRFFDHRKGAEKRGRYTELTINERNAFQEFSYQWAKECLRVLKPGGHLLSFGGARTYHRMVCGVEDAGFEIRDTIMYLYGSGFPKSHNIGKAVDKMQGNERKVIGKDPNSAPDLRDVGKISKEKIGIDKLSFGQVQNAKRKELKLTKGNSKWEGWGTALKPAVEPIVLARKPISEKTIAKNVLKWGTGGLNIDRCRVEYKNEKDFNDTLKSNTGNIAGGTFKCSSKKMAKEEVIKPQGRFPANIIHDGSDEVVRGFPKANQGHWSKTKTQGYGKFGGGQSEYQGAGRKDNIKKSAARFFYCAKASKFERNKGLEGFEEKVGKIIHNRRCKKCKHQEVSGSPCKCKKPDWEILKQERKAANYHPTIKPISLMCYLIRLITPLKGIVLDCFTGSGSTLIAAKIDGFNWLGIEKEEDYVKIARARIKAWEKETKQQKLL